jgi:hypothetical protein|tara:strand:- start:2652 stop:3374 length:723 start_codon:yes stop_codon:yes gene_type:complete
MAYDYLGLVNDVNRRLNEVELTSSNFATATGEYSMIKDAINSAIRYINQHEYQWPFNHVEAEETLTAGTVRYAYPADAKTIDMDSFRIKRDDTLGNITRRLKVLSYEDYLDNYIDSEYNTDSTSRSIPSYVFRAPSQEFGLVNVPDKAYTLVYEYYRLPVDLINATDVPSIPEQFRYIILNGAMHFAYMFRGETQESALIQNRFDDEIKQMRSLYINRYEYLRSTVIHRSGSSYNSIKVS